MILKDLLRFATPQRWSRGRFAPLLSSRNERFLPCIVTGRVRALPYRYSVRSIVKKLPCESGFYRSNEPGGLGKYRIGTGPVRHEKEKKKMC